MAINVKIFWSILILLPIIESASSDESQLYIVYFGEHSGQKSYNEIEETHHSYLSSVKETKEEAISSLLYSYKHSINGFAAVLSRAEASKLSQMEEVVSVFTSQPWKHTMHTTRSWEFVGLEEEIVIKSPFKMGKTQKNLLARAKYGRNVIVGLLDSDQALGDEVEMHDEAATAMEEEIESGDSSCKGRSSSASKKQKRDRLADAITKFTDCFSEYIQSKLKEIVKPTPLKFTTL